MTWAASPVVGRCSFGWWRMLERKNSKHRKGRVVRTRLKTEPLRRRGAGGRIELRRLRTGVLRLGSSIGFNTRTVVQFSEAISGQRWRHCQGYDLERVVGELAQIGRRMAPRDQEETRPR